MPLVHISFLKGKPPGFGPKVAGVVYRAMVDVMKVPERDNFQIIKEHEAGQLVYDPTYLDIARTDGLIFIELTLLAGRTAEVKEAFYAAVADGLHRHLGVRKEDVFIVLTGIGKDDVSFGNGVAQYLHPT